MRQLRKKGWSWEPQLSKLFHPRVCPILGVPFDWFSYACVLSRLSRVGLCNPMDCTPPGSSVHGILQARILEWVAIPFSSGSSLLRIEPVSLMSPAWAAGFFTITATWETLKCGKGQLDLEFVAPSGGEPSTPGPREVYLLPIPHHRPLSLSLRTVQPWDWSLHWSRFVTPAQVPKA